MDARAATRAWIEAWQSAWPANAVDRITAAFDTEGHVVAQRDYWDQCDGATEPPSGWGR